MRTSALFFAAAVTMLSLIGCGGGGSDLPELIPVQGTILLDDKPVSGATVSFAPVGEGNVVTGVTDAEGKYELIYSNENKGIPEGSYRVSVAYGEFWEPTYPDGFDEESASEAEKAKYTTPPVEIPARYSGEDTSLEAEVKQGNSDPIDFKLISGSEP